MADANMNIILMVGGLVSVILLITIIFLVRTLGAGRKADLEKIERFKVRFADKATVHTGRSIRLQSNATGLAGRLSALIPQRDELEKRFAKAGLKIDLSRYAIICGSIFIGTFITVSLMGMNGLTAILVSLCTGMGGPHFYVGKLMVRRIKMFTSKFPEALDMIVRGLKSGLPVNECIINVAREVADPIGTEFQHITDRVKLGKTLEDALWETSNRLDTPDFKFFVICLAVQRETGGNLGETLENLSTILRSRQQMKLKIKAMSSEAKASALIVGVLPFMMLGLIMMMNYEYGIILFTHPTAIFAGVIGLVWMSFGIFVMSKLITFEV